MLKLKILSVGKTKEKWLEDAFNEYLKRLQNTTQVDCQWAKDTSQLIEWTQKEAFFLCLDPEGLLFTSEDFSKFLIDQWEKQGSRLTLVIGGAEGLPAELKQKARLISLSPLTFTHQMTRLILIEQVYRALEIHRGSHYHK
jgi:23S rRNA (pseudouridine1915-N3)-methyltransferase